MEVPCLSDLDTALHELGMLSSVTEVRRDYVREQRQHQCNVSRQALNVLHMNTRFVTGVVIGRHKSPSFRYKPYSIPCLAREERARTKSENADVELERFCGSTLSPVISNTPEKTNTLYKSRSLEDVKATVSDETEDFPTQDVESVSDKIQHLQVCE